MAFPFEDFDATQLCNNINFFRQLSAIQNEARKKLREVKAYAAEKVESDRKDRRDTNNKNLATLLGVGENNSFWGDRNPHHHYQNRRLHRHLLTEMNINQLQVILNYLFAQVETLNENLVQFLITRDELAIEQDSLLTDVEDITKCISVTTSPTPTSSPCAL